MADVFISYSRKDAEFVRRLHQALADQGRDIWIDWEDIPLTADWWREICAGIEAADTFMFVISPDSVRSEVCRREIEHAVSNNKRLVPVNYREVTDPADKTLVHPAIHTHNWVFFREDDDFDRSFQALIQAIETDLGHVRAHTRLLVRAKDWETRGHDSSQLLRGSDLAEAEAWLYAGAGKKPLPGDLHRSYIAASRKAETARQRTTVGALTGGLVLALALAVIAFFQWQAAARNAALANDNAATATFALGLAADSAATAVAAAATIEGFIAKTTISRESVPDEGGRVSVRSAPGADNPVVYWVNYGDEVSVLGKSESGDWYLIERAADGQKQRGWIYAPATGETPPLVIEVPVVRW